MSKNVLKTAFLACKKMGNFDFNEHHEFYAYKKFFGDTQDKSAPRAKRDCLNLSYRRLYLKLFSIRNGVSTSFKKLEKL